MSHVSGTQKRKKTKRKENIEVNTFMKELENALKTNNIANSKGVYTTLYDEVLNEIDLATKYKGKLNNIIKECMKIGSLRPVFSCY